MNGARFRWQVAALIAIVLLAFGLRIFRLDAQSLWNDEGTSVALARRDLTTITRDAAHDIHPPLYYYLLHGWIRLAGTTEFSVRFVSVLAGVALVACVARMASRLYGPVAPIIASLLVAISPFQVYYSQETRMYVVVSLFGLLSMLAHVRLLRTWADSERPRPILASILYLVASIGAVYTHYYAFALLLAQNLGFLIWLRQSRGGHERWQRVFHWAGLQALILATYVPWLLLSWRSLTAWPAVSAPLSITRLLIDVSQVFSLGEQAAVTRTASILSVMLSALILPGLLRSLPARPREHDVARAQGQRARFRWAAILHLAVPILVVYLLSLRRPMYKGKFLLLATPAYHMLQAQGIVTLANTGRQLFGVRWARGSIAIALVVAVSAASIYSLVGLYTDESTFRDDYRSIAAYIKATASDHDAVIINAPAQVETFDYYYDNALPVYPLPKQRPIDTAQTHGELERIIERHSRIYAIYWATDESDPQGFIEGWLDQRTFKSMNSWFGNVRLAVYAIPQTDAQRIEHTRRESFGDSIRLRGYTLLTQKAVSGDTLQLTLFWEATKPIDTRYKVFTHIVDGRGNIVGQRDSDPGGGGRLTTGWQPGELIPDNYGMPISPGTPPGDHVLRVGIYNPEDGVRLPISRGEELVGDALDLVTVPIGPATAPPPVTALGIHSRDNARFGSLELIGHDLYRLGHAHEPETPLRPGDTATLVLYWRKTGDATITGEFAVALGRRSGQAEWQQTLQITDGAYRPEAWRQGEIVRDIHRLSLPPDLPEGKYRLSLQPVGSLEDRPYTLQRVTIERGR